MRRTSPPFTAHLLAIVLVIAFTTAIASWPSSIRLAAGNAFYFEIYLDLLGCREVSPPCLCADSVCVRPASDGDRGQSASNADQTSVLVEWPALPQDLVKGSSLSGLVRVEVRALTVRVTRSWMLLTRAPKNGSPEYLSFARFRMLCQASVRDGDRNMRP